MCVTPIISVSIPLLELLSLPLPEFWVTVSCPFGHTGVDFAGPVYVRDTADVEVWLSLYTCCTTHAVHLNLVESLNADSFMWSLNRFTSSRGIPVIIVSENGTTSTAAAKMLEHMFTDSILEPHLLSHHTHWDFNFLLWSQKRKQFSTQGP